MNSMFTTFITDTSMYHMYAGFLSHFHQFAKHFVNVYLKRSRNLAISKEISFVQASPRKFKFPAKEYSETTTKVESVSFFLARKSAKPTTSEKVDGLSPYNPG